jgi:thioredoxin 1
MNQPTNQAGASGPWLLIIGLLMGAGLLVFMAWDGLSHSKGGAKASEHVVELTEANWEREVLDSDIPVVVDFSAVWCPPCQAFAPTLEKIADRYQGKVKVGKLDVGDHGFDKAQKLAKEYGIRGIPQILIFKRGELRKQFEGGPSEATLAREIDRVLN